MSSHKSSTPVPIVPPENRFAFILIATCFGLWGMINQMTELLVPAVQKIFSIDNTQSVLVQFVNYGSYALLAFPAALINKRFNYKTGVTLGLIFLCIGAGGIVPAGTLKMFSPLLGSIAILACGLSILETSCNPYVLAMGAEETAVRRLNLAQTINPIGCLLGLFAAKFLILGHLDKAEAAERASWTADQAHKVMTHELFWLALPYAIMVGVAILMLIALRINRMPEGRDTEHAPHVMISIQKLLANKRYAMGVVTQFFYVGLQVAVWTFVIKYTREAALITVGADGKVVSGLTEGDASWYMIASMVVFTVARMVCTALMRKLNPASMMATLAVLGIILTVGAIFLPGMLGVVCLVLISACLSLMFPTIYGIALRDLGPEVKLGASGLIMAIVGGSLGSLSQGYLMDKLMAFGIRSDWAVRYSFVIPIFCLIVVLSYALKYRAFCATAPTSTGPVAGH